MQPANGNYSSSQITDHTWTYTRGPDEETKNMERQQMTSYIHCMWDTIEHFEMWKPMHRILTGAQKLPTNCSKESDPEPGCTPKLPDSRGISWHIVAYRGISLEH